MIKLNDIFGNYKNSNVDLLNKYIKETDVNLENIKNFGFPFFKGTSNFKYVDYLKNKNLNNEPMNYKDILNDLAPLFENLPNWNNPGTMINVIPPVNIMAMAFSSYAAMYNPNFAQDTYSGHLITSELEVSKYMAQLVGWNWKLSKGIFTFGGKGTSLYATKIALSKANYETHKKGVEKGKYFLLSSENAHPCHYQVCDWLGLGSEACIEIPCLKNGKIDLDKTEQIIDKNIREGKILIGYNLNGGSTNELFIDPVKKVNELNEKIIKRYNLSYRPHIHIDSVIGWIFLFFKNYNFVENKLNIPIRHLKKIKSLYNCVSEFKYADSLGIDFHKTGFCPYISSLFLCKKSEDYYKLNKDKNMMIDELKYGNYNPYDTTLELTRSSQGALSALVSLKSLGFSGFQEIIAKLFSSTEYFREKISSIDDMLLITDETEGFATMCLLKPKKYKNYTLDMIKCSNDVIINDIRNYNQLFGKYVYNLALNQKINFVFTASRSYTIPMTKVKIGVLKMYPMSVFLDYEYIDILIENLRKVILSFNENYHFVTSGLELKDDMVYSKNR